MNKVRFGSVSTRLILAAAVILVVVWGVYGLGWFSTDGDSSSGGNTTDVIAAGLLSWVDGETGEELTNEELVETVGSAVVTIVTETVSEGWFFQPVPVTGAGTGVIFSPDGYIVTNNHVVEGADEVTVTLSDGTTYEPISIATDPVTDLAVIHIDASDLPYLRFLEDSLDQLNELDEVVAVGNALALSGGPTWTSGVVSNLGRSIELEDGDVLSDLIQTDAAINSGNSGGPLVNRAGQVVGINVAVATDAENIGFAISTDTAIPVIASLVEDGSVTYPWLGVSMTTVTSVIQQRYGLSVDSGAFIVGVSNGSPADIAGIRAGDVITGLGGEGIDTADDLGLAIRSHEIGDEVEIEYYRGSQQMTTAAVLGESSG